MLTQLLGACERRVAELEGDQTTGNRKDAYPDTKFWDPEPTDAPADESPRAIDVAREYVNRQAGKPVEATYTAKRTSDGYRVYVEYVIRDKRGQPRSFFGGDCTIDISKDWQVSQVIGGL